MWSRSDLGFQRIKLDRLDSTGVLDGLREQSIGAPCDQLLGIPEVQRAVLEGAGDKTLGMFAIGRAPCDVEEPVGQVSTPVELSCDFKDLLGICAQASQGL